MAQLAFALLATLFVDLSGAKTVTSKLDAGTVIYGVVPPLFGKKPFRDVTRKLDMIKDLGIDILWLSPINQTDDPSLISYAVSDYFSHRSDFGTAEDLKALIRQAHLRGLKVIMDFVPNHTSKAHPYYVDIEANGRASTHYSAYQRDSSGKIQSYFDWNHLLNLNYSDSKVAAMIEKAFKHWISNFGIDGFRIDAAWGIKERAPSFWPRLTASLLKIKPGLILLAEASAHDPYYTESGFDLAYDWTKKVGQWAWDGLFADPMTIAKKLHQVLTSNQQAHRTLRFLNNNDTGLRFITRHGLAFTRLAAVLQHTIPGVPLVYMGDEVGAEFEPYEDPEPLDWQDTHSLRAFYKKLIRLRKQFSPLASPEWVSLYSAQHPQTYAYLRTAKGHDPLMIVLNFGEETTLRVPQSYLTKVAADSLRDILNEQNIKLDGARSQIRIKARNAAILQL